MQLLSMVCFGAILLGSQAFSMQRLPLPRNKKQSTRFWNSARNELLEYLETINSDPSRLPCGIEVTEAESQQAEQLIQQTVQSDASEHLSRKANAQIVAKDVIGAWELVYTSSRTFRINKSLSGLGRSSSDMANFSRLTMILSGSKFLGYVEFDERIGDSVRVSIKGEFELQDERDPYDNTPTKAIRCDLESVSYGVTTNSADDWSSLGPVKLMDILYLDTSLLLCRGNVNPETLFVWQRVEAD